MKVNWVRLVISLPVGFISALGKEDDFLANNSIALLAIFATLYVLICSLMIYVIQRLREAFNRASNKENQIEKAEKVIKPHCIDNIGSNFLKIGLWTLLLIIQATLLHYFKYPWLSMTTHTIVNTYMVWTYFEFYSWVVNLFGLVGHLSAKDKNQNRQNKY